MALRNIFGNNPYYFILCKKNKKQNKTVLIAISMIFTGIITIINFMSKY